MNAGGTVIYQILLLFRVVNEISISVYLTHVHMVRLNSTVYDGNADAPLAILNFTITKRPAKLVEIVEPVISSTLCSARRSSG